MEQWVPKLAAQHSVAPEDAEEWARQHVEDFDPDNAGDSYGRVVDQLFPTTASRRIEIDRLCRGRNPGFGYGVLSALMTRESGAFNIVLTTNFDDLLTDALYVFQGDHPLVIGEDRLADYIDPGSNQRMIVKLHGAYQMKPRNSPEEIEKLDSVMHDRVKSLLIGRGLVVIGYGGNDPSIRSLLSGLPSSSVPSGVWWISRRSPEPVIDECLSGHRARWVKSDDFDSLMYQAFADFKLEPPNPDRVNSIFESWVSSYGNLSDRTTEEPGFTQARRDLASRPEDEWLSELSALSSVLAEQDEGSKDGLFEAAIAKFPKSGRLFGAYANFLARQGRDLDRADRMYKRAIELDSTSPIQLTNYAIFLEQQRDDPEAAEKLLLQAIEIDPRNAFALSFYAVVLGRRGDDLEAADEMFKRAIEIEPSNAVILGAYGTFLFMRVGDLDAAREMYDHAVEMNAPDANVWGNFALLEYQQGNREKADLLAERAVAALTSDTLKDTQVEVMFYRWAAGEPDVRAEARAETLRLIDEGVRSPGWNFDALLEIARQEERDDLDELERAAATISEQDHT